MRVCRVRRAGGGRRAAGARRATREPRRWRAAARRRTAQCDVYMCNLGGTPGVVQYLRSARSVPLRRCAAHAHTDPRDLAHSAHPRSQRCHSALHHHTYQLFLYKSTHASVSICRPHEIESDAPSLRLVLCVASRKVCRKRYTLRMGIMMHMGIRYKESHYGFTERLHSKTLVWGLIKTPLPTAPQEAPSFCLHNFSSRASTGVPPPCSATPSGVGGARAGSPPLLSERERSEVARCV